MEDKVLSNLILISISNNKVLGSPTFLSPSTTLWIGVVNINVTEAILNMNILSIQVREFSKEPNVSNPSVYVIIIELTRYIAITGAKANDEYIINLNPLMKPSDNRGEISIMNEIVAKIT